jgi:capsular polysaccharide biosynthesis protein
MAKVRDRLRRLDEVAYQRYASAALDTPSRLKPARRRSRTLIEVQEEGYFSLGRSAVRHWPVLAVVILLGLLFGIGAGGVISPTYTARAEVIIGKSLNLTNTAAISGFPSAEAQLAQNYARLAGTPAYESALQAKLGRPLQGWTNATGVAQSPIIDVYGYSRSQADAVALANAASAALIDTINSVNQQTSTANQSLLSQYQTQSVVLEQDQQKVTELQAKIAATGGPTRSPLQAELVQASAAVDTDRFKLNTLGNQYAAEFNPNQAIQEAVYPLGGAAAQGGNRTTHIEIGGIAGLVAGVLVGLAIAAFMDVAADRRFRRAFNL